MGRLLGLGLVSFVVLWAQSQPDATFRSGVKLVQVSVVAQDKQGKPIADLRRDEFQIFDNGSRQEIRLFLAETEKANPAPLKIKAPSTFTNQIASPTGSYSGYSVILIDNLLTRFGDPFKEDGSANVRLQALRTLRSIPVGERIAIYALRWQLQVICEFTSDRDALKHQLQAWTPSPDPEDSILGDGTQKGDAPANVAVEFGRIDGLQRASAENGDMELVADHLAGIPGRKNLIWLPAISVSARGRCKNSKTRTSPFIPWMRPARKVRGREENRCASSQSRRAVSLIISATISTSPFARPWMTDASATLSASMSPAHLVLKTPPDSAPHP